MAFNNKNIALLAHLQDLAQRTDTLIQILNSRYDANVTASTDSNADYATEVVDARVDSQSNNLGSLGANIRNGQMLLQREIDTEAYARIEDNDSLQRQINTVAKAVMMITCLYSEIKEQLRSGKSDSQ